MAPAATILASEEDGATVWRAEGEWLVITAAELDRRLRGLDMPQGRQVTVDLSRIDRLDSSGAWLLLRTEHELVTRGNQVELANLQPRFAPGLAVTVDYYNINIKDAISFLDPQDAADKCVDGPALADQYCSLIIRDPVSKQIVSYLSSYLNQASLKTAGYDIQVSYTHGVADWTSGWGRLSWLDGQISGSINANYIEKLRQFAFEDFPDTVDRQEGELEERATLRVVGGGFKL